MKKYRNLLIGVLAGLLLGGGIAFGLSWPDYPNMGVGEITGVDTLLVYDQDDATPAKLNEITYTNFIAGLEIDLLTDNTKSFVINAATADDDFLLWRTNVAITITDIYGVLLTGTNVVGGLDECDANGANPVAVDADITFDGDLDQDDSDLTNGEIDAGDWIYWHTTSVNLPGYLTVTIVYTID